MVKTENTLTKKVLRLLQISDSHLYKDASSGKLIGMNTDESFRFVLELVKQNELLNGVPTFDLVLATGDISQDGSEASYHRFAQLLQPFNKPVYYLPGNHDKLQAMQQVISDPKHLAPCVIELGAWSVIMLDSSIPGEVPGRFSDKALDELRQILQASHNKHVAVCLHHHPIPVGSQWLDGVGLLEADKFLQVIDEFDHVKVVINGHVHQDHSVVRNNIPYYSLPSTCIQFAPKSPKFAVDSVSPGYRWFEFYDDGTLQTAVCRVEGFSFEVDQSISGY